MKSRSNVVEPIRSKEDIARIIEYLDNNHKHKYAVLFILGINSGLRVSDLLGFKVKDVFQKTFIIILLTKGGMPTWRL